MKHSLTRIPTLLFIFTVLSGAAFVMQGPFSTALLGEEAATTTPSLEEIPLYIPTSTASATTDILTPDLATSTASSTEVATTTKSAVPAEVDITTDDTLFLLSPRDCQTKTARQVFANPGECMRSLYNR